MNKFFTKIILSIISILIGVTLCEITGRFIGLGKPILYQGDPLVGYRLKPNQRVQRLKKKFVTTNKEGFRISKKDGKKSIKKIVFIGDSVTYGGSYIDDSELFSQIFCQISEENDYCLNGGINAWGSQNMGRFISNFGIYSDIKPKEFILIMLPGDERRNLRSFSNTPYWANKPKQPSAISEVLRFIITEKIIPALNEENLDASLVSRTEDFDKLIDIQRKVSWEELKMQLIKSKYPINFLITPPERWFKNKLEYNQEIKVYDNLLKDISSINVIKNSCNLYYQIKDKYDPNLYVDGIHLSIKGHKVWAESIKSCLSIKN